ncbi:MAG: class III aminotransferase, partial [Kiritimatiellia bacterium]|nr:class III aminotransferase [Kiritimatiellia bacterium]
GRLVQAIWKDQSVRYGLPVMVEGYPCLTHFKFDHPQHNELRTLFVQGMLERGFLAGCGFSPTLAHTESIVALYKNAVAEVFAGIALALSQNKVKEKLKGPPAHSGFQRLI